MMDIYDMASVSMLWPLLANHALDAKVEEMARRVSAATEAEVKRMLGLWVSELEPNLLYGPQGELLGLTIAGLPMGVVAPVVVRARPIEVVLTDRGRVVAKWPHQGVAKVQNVIRISKEGDGISAIDPAATYTFEVDGRIYIGCVPEDAGDCWLFRLPETHP